MWETLGIALVLLVVALVLDGLRVREAAIRIVGDACRERGLQFLDYTVQGARTRLARVGLERVSGYLKDGVLAWHEAGLPLAPMEQIPVEELRHRLEERSVDVVIDVRRPGEWNSSHIPGAMNMPLWIEFFLLHEAHHLYVVMQRVREPEVSLK